MHDKLRDKFYGSSIEERLESVPNELAVDAVGLWQIVSFGRQGFDLSGDQLTDYVRRHILALLAKGAKPVVGAQDGVHLWIVSDYPGAPEEVADSIIKEWHSTGRDPSPGDIWFALPHIYEAVRPHAVLSRGTNH